MTKVLVIVMFICLIFSVLSIMVTPGNDDDKKAARLAAEEMARIRCQSCGPIKPVHLFFTPLKRPFKRTLSPRAAGCLLVALGPLGRARRMSKKDEDGDEHEHAKVGLRVLDEGTSKLSSQGVGRYRWSAFCGGRPRARSQRRDAAPRATWAASGTAGVRREAGLGRRRDAWPVLRPSRTFKRRQPAARPRILHTRRHDRDERPRCQAMV